MFNNLLDANPIAIGTTKINLYEKYKENNSNIINC
jgi:hypothetical protein